MSNNSPADSLRALAYMLTPGMEYPGTIEIETLPILRDYYTYCGNSDSAAIVQAMLSELTTKAKAYKAATEMTRMNMERHLERALANRDTLLQITQNMALDLSHHIHHNPPRSSDSDRTAQPPQTSMRGITRQRTRTRPSAHHNSKTPGSRKRTK